MLEITSRCGGWGCESLAIVPKGRGSEVGGGEGLRNTGSTEGPASINQSGSSAKSALKQTFFQQSQTLRMSNTWQLFWWHPLCSWIWSPGASSASPEPSPAPPRPSAWLSAASAPSDSGSSPSPRPRGCPWGGGPWRRLVPEIRGGLDGGRQLGKHWTLSQEGFPHQTHTRDLLRSTRPSSTSGSCSWGTLHG